jgi:hypothetical protein
MSKLDTHNVDVVTGANYFVVGHGTEGGNAPYQLSVAGITGAADSAWGKVDRVKADSGYSIGVIQVDLGKRGTWALGSTKESVPSVAGRTYVDALIEESERFANQHGLGYTHDKAALRASLLSHGNGKDKRGTLTFIEKETYASFNAWASSAEGQPWIHRNVDYPQIRHATEAAMGLLDRYGKNVQEDKRFEVIAILAKTENQIPQKMKVFEKILKAGGGYDEIVAGAGEISRRFGYYAGLKAADVARKYEVAREDPQQSVALDRAQTKVARADFNPATIASDPDFQTALQALSLAATTRVLHEGSHGEHVVALQTNLAKLGITDARGHALHADGAFGPSTREAVELFQRGHGLASDGRVGTKTLQALGEAMRPTETTLADRGHPGHALFCQALEGVHVIDAKCGRTPDAWSNNLAASLATAAHAQGLVRIDQVMLGDNATRAFAVQGDPGSPFKRVASVDVLPAITRPLEQSSAEFRALATGTPQQLHELAAGPATAPPVLPELQR